MHNASVCVLIYPITYPLLTCVWEIESGSANSAVECKQVFEKGQMRQKETKITLKLDSS